jgi:tetratricopeptide (TPR) repeat protein
VGLGGFGKDPLPAVLFRTSWTTTDIWLRRTFDWPANPTVQTLVARALHDDGFELYLNGKQVLSRKNYNGAYDFYLLDANALPLLKPGPNTLAVHCRSMTGLQHIDVGLYGETSEPRTVQRRLTAINLTDSWEKLAAAYELLGDQPALEKLFAHHPAAAAVGLGDLYAADQDWERAIATYSRRITPQTTDGNLLTRRAAAYEATGRWELAAADWLQAARLQPTLTQAAFDRFCRAGQWKPASRFGSMLVDQQPEDSLRWLRMIALLVMAEDEEQYRESCRRMVLQFSESTKVEDAERILKAGLLRAKVIDLASLPADRLAKALDDGEAAKSFASWGWATRALLAYRNGDAESAAEYVARSEALEPSAFTRVLNFAILAMAEHQRQHSEEARRALDEAVRLYSRLQVDGNNRGHHDLLIAEILLQEARGLVAPPLSPVDQP